MSDIGNQIAALIDTTGPGYAWVPGDFAQLGSRDVIDKTLQRMVARGPSFAGLIALYDEPSISSLSGRDFTQRRLHPLRGQDRGWCQIGPHPACFCQHEALS